MSSRAWVGAGAAVGTAIALVLLVRMQTGDVSPPESSRALAPPRQDAIVSEDGPRVVDTVVGEAAPLSTPTPTQLESVRAGLLTELPSTATPPITPVPLNGGPLSEWATEPVDADWAPGARTSIVSRLAEQPGLKLVALNVECKTTMCLVEIAQPGAGSEPPLQLLNTTGMQARFIMMLKGEPGMQRSVAFLMRPGVALPEMAAQESTIVRAAEFRLQ